MPYIIVVMKITLPPEEKQELEILHSQEKNRRKADRIKSVLLRDEGWSLTKIAQALRIHTDTVSRYIADYLEHDSFDFKHQGSQGQLSEKQSSELAHHLEENLYTKVVEIVVYVKNRFNVTYTVSGMTDWLHRNNFAYKSPKGSPAKADIAKQREFIEIYNQLKEMALQNDEPILFIDGVHPSMQTKISHGWIRKGQEKEVDTTASKTRVNILGAVDLDSMSVLAREYGKTINGRSVINFLDAIKEQYIDKKVIHLILDQAGYNIAFEVREHASKLGIHLHYLPAYSPNLNSIERLWKVMNEEIRNNVFFRTAKEFRLKIRWFFDQRLSEILPGLRTRISDNFHIKNAAK
jgi:transposase